MKNDFYRHKHPHYGRPSTEDRLLTIKAWRGFNEENKLNEKISHISILQLEREESFQNAGIKERAHS